MLTLARNLLVDLESGRFIKIKIFNLGENIGQDFAYFSYYLILKKLFPNVYLHLCRSNVDETNTIGYENYKGRVQLPIDEMDMAIVKQRYPDGLDWVQKINKGELDIFPYDFLDIAEYDYVWTIGMASSPTFKSVYYFPNIEQIESHIVRDAIELHNAIKSTDTPIKIPNTCENLEWERTALEYLCYQDEDYPFKFLPEFAQNPLATDYKDYLRIGLRWPDSVRWYYSIDRQYEVIFSIIEKIKKLGKKVKIIYSLKDGEIGNNFLRDQTVEKLKKVQDMCDDILFTYSWVKFPYSQRLSEEEELSRLRQVGITNIKKIDLWEDLLLSANCKVYLSEPGGFSEVISMVRKNTNTTFLFPPSCMMIGTYLTLNKDRKPIRMKVNPITIQQIYSCKAIMSPEGDRTIHWMLSYNNEEVQIGNDCHGDDWKYFEEAQENVFKRWFEKTKDELVAEVVKEYIK